ncbi:MAG: hypothetical protein NTZ42_03050 [Candidatus Gribaldobacteria bacterium]|nr:hypothetical protein [Candidatus Gribaldobacteria bacterium]
MKFFNREKNHPSIKEKLPEPETKNEVKLVGAFKIEVGNKKGLENILLSGGKITALVDLKAEKIFLKTSEASAIDPNSASSESVKYSYSIEETTSVGNNMVPEGKLNLLDPKDSAIIEQVADMAEPDVRKIIEARIKNCLPLETKSPDQIKKPSIIAPLAPARESILSQEAQKNEIAKIRKILEEQDAQNKIEGKK